MCRPQRYFDSCATIRKKNYTQNFPRQVSNNIASCVAHFYCKQIKMIFFFFMRQIQRLVNFRLPISSIIMVTSTAVLKEYMIQNPFCCSYLREMRSGALFFQNSIVFCTLDPRGYTAGASTPYNPWCCCQQLAGLKELKITLTRVDWNSEKSLTLSILSNKNIRTKVNNFFRGEANFTQQI